MRANVLFICGSLNQTAINHRIAQQLDDCRCHFTPFYGDGMVDVLANAGLLDFTILGGQARARSERFLLERGCAIDFRGTARDYDLVVTCSDLIVPANVAGKRLVLVQEGMVDPWRARFRVVRALHLPRYLANTAMTGLSHSYDAFCVASEGFKRLFVRNGVDGSRVVVTGIPGYDHVRGSLSNDFPHRGYVLAVTSHLRETLKYENRRAFIKRAVEVAAGRRLLFKLHPGERADRAKREIRQHAPGSLIYRSGNVLHMVANCHSLVTRYSSVMLVALALGKPVYADLDEEVLRGLAPMQNGGRSAGEIAGLLRGLIGRPARVRPAALVQG